MSKMTIKFKKKRETNQSGYCGKCTQLNRLHNKDKNSVLSSKETPAKSYTYLTAN